MEKDIKYINKNRRSEKRKVGVIVLLLLFLLFVIVNYVEGLEKLALQDTEILDSTSPEIVLDENNVYKMEVNGEIPAILAAARDNKDTNPNITVNTSNVNPNEVGEYLVTITATDDEGNITTEEIIFEVVDTVAPFITLNGNNPVYHQINTEYVDEGVTVTDNYDSVENIQVLVTNTVNSNVLGTYSVTYVATDRSGNVSETITRTVVVIDKVTVVLPKGNINYSITELTFEPVTATLITNKEIITPEGWTKIDAVTYVKTYTENITELIIIMDLDGNTGTVNIKIENIQKRFGMSDGSWSIEKGVNTPKLSSGMIPIKYNGTNWIVCSTNDLEWYDYINQEAGVDGTSKWANIMLSDGVYKSDTVAVGQVVQENELRKYVCMDTKVCI